MTIKEIEQRSGMARANIRFYESQGLISPKRGENGYRDYSEDDLLELERIKLLRALELPLDEIRLIQTGERALDEVMSEHIGTLEEESHRIENAKEICRNICGDHVSYSELDAAAYLVKLSGNAAAPESDRIPKVRSPWRRFFARALDFSIYDTVWWAIIAAFTSSNLTDSSPGMDFIGTLFAIILMIALEPVMLHFFGTTPGKWILGLSVTDVDGKRLSYSSAMERTLNVIVFGEGIHIPLVSLYCNWKSYKRCEAEETQPWDGDSVLVLKDERGIRAVGYIAAYAVIIFIMVILALGQRVPPNRGEVTLAEFSENFNQIAEYANITPEMRLDENGDWIEYGGTVINVFGDESEYPDFEYVLDGDVLTAVSFTVERTGEIAYDHSTEGSLLTLAFVRAQKGFFGFGDETSDVLDKVGYHQHETWEMTANGVTVSNIVTYSGFDEYKFGSEGIVQLWPKEGETQSYSVTFTMELAD